MGNQEEYLNQSHLILILILLLPVMVTWKWPLSQGTRIQWIIRPIFKLSFWVNMGYEVWRFHLMEPISTYSFKWGWNGKAKKNDG